ncbi:MULTISPECIES: helix-turn-helix domain-containing protein [unclassified Nocardia]|uniref:helix-turn-helix domain-containing protein n=1 Tax=unclassified Nocardia TaxID=2637762 RepID=UPI0027E0FC4D|nr:MULTISPECIES: helix-turn-helix domain-containing protein [unclassified Nocardia]
MVHPNAIRYRIDRYHALTGVDLRKPAVALELWWVLQRHRLPPPGCARSRQIQ